jgi:hypothetical protein
MATFTIQAASSGSATAPTVVPQLACVREHVDQETGGFVRANLVSLKPVNGASRFGVVIPDSPDFKNFRFADIRLIGTTADGAKPFDYTLNTWVTSRLAAVLVACTAVILLAASLAYIADKRKIAGNPLISPITKSNGYLSLSQFQILTFTYVVGGGALYVVVLSGNLIDLSSNILILLGITGITALGALPTPTGPVVATPSSPTVSDFRVLDSGDTGVVLVWYPAIGAQNPQYIIQRKDAGATDWTDIGWSDTTFFAADDLTPHTSYSFQITTVSGGVRGRSQGPVPVTTTAIPAAGPSMAPGRPNALSVTKVA